MNTVTLGPILLKTPNQEVILETLVEVERGTGKREIVVVGGGRKEGRLIQWQEIVLPTIE